ncbi:MAG: hypothetical protein ACRDEA_11650, partial [Microcystaceae cyanobacterium]
MPSKKTKNQKRPQLQEDLATRVEQLTTLLNCLEKELQEIDSSGEVAPPGCWIVRYQAKGRNETYWYYKLHATQEIFSTRTEGKMSQYKHLGKAGSQAYLNGVIHVLRRSQIDGLNRAIQTLKSGLVDLTDEGTR